MASLKDQLLKAGLISKKQAEGAEAKQRRVEYEAKKNSELGEKLSQEKEQELKKIEEEKQKQKEKDKALNQKRDQLIAERELTHRVRQILNSQALLDRNAEEPYYFAEGKTIRKILVTAYQREMLARGKLGIGRAVEGVDEFVLIARETAQMVESLLPARILLLHSELSGDEDIFSES